MAGRHRRLRFYCRHWRSGKARSAPSVSLCPGVSGSSGRPGCLAVRVFAFPGGGTSSFSRSSRRLKKRRGKEKKKKKETGKRKRTKAFEKSGKTTKFWIKSYKKVEYDKKIWSTLLPAFFHGFIITSYKQLTFFKAQKFFFVQVCVSCSRILFLLGLSFVLPVLLLPPPTPPLREKQGREGKTKGLMWN